MRATVVIPCYRPDEHFDMMLGDLNAQTSQDFEVIFADDGNDPPLKSRIDSVLRRPFQVIRFETNQGIVAGLNACVQAVTTPYIIRMDADDRMPPDRIARQIQFLDLHTEVEVVGTSMAVFGSKIRLWSKPTDAATIRAGLLWGPTINHPSVAARTEVLKRFPYPDDYPLGEDYALWVTLVANGVNVRNDSYVGLYYRLGQQNTSQTNHTERSKRYVALHRLATKTLLADADISSLTPGLDNGAHLLLSGINPGHLTPTMADVDLHAQSLMAVLRELKSLNPNPSWVDKAMAETEIRRQRVLGNRRLHKLQDVWDLRKMTFTDWEFLFLQCR